MPRLAFAVVLLVAQFSVYAAFAADPLVIDRWQGKTPDDAGILR